MPSPPPFSTRDAVENDLPRIVEIYNAAVPGRAATADLHPVTVESRRAWFAAHSPDRHPLWVAEIDEKVVAWIGIAPLFPRAAYHITAEVSIYIDPAYHGQGIGSELLGRMIARCPTLGIENLVSLVYAHNAASRRLNEKHGFVEWGYWPGVTEVDGHRRDVVVLGRKISPA